MIKNELKNNLEQFCPEIQEKLYLETATDIVIGNKQSTKSELALAIRHHYLNETEITNQKRGNALSQEECMKLCEAAALLGAGLACEALIGCIFAPVGGFIGLALCYDSC
jgi:hypothetical protein